MLSASPRSMSGQRHAAPLDTFLVFMMFTVVTFIAELVKR
jgi:hypothetical protein